jgi:hypothetical protein
MPILPFDAPEIALVPARFESALPSASTIGGRLSPVLQRASGLAGPALENISAISAQIARGISMTTGWPEYELAQLKSMIRTLLQPLTDFMREQAAKLLEFVGTTLSTEINEIIDVITSNLTGIPIVGIVFTVIRGIWFAVTESFKYTIPSLAAAPDQPALFYDRDADEDSTRALLGVSSALDWTNIWSPPGGSFDSARIAYTSSGRHDGFAWGQLPWLQSPSGGWGCVPGVTTIAGYWQTPYNKPGATKRYKWDSDVRSSQWATVSDIYSQGKLLPSMTTTSALLWASAQRAAPTLGRVDYAALESGWNDYTTELVAYANWVRKRCTNVTKDDTCHPWFRSQIMGAWSWCDPSSKASFYEGVTWSSMPASFRDPSMLSLIKFKLYQARVAVMRSFGSSSIAYVPDDAPVLKDPRVRSLFDRQRKLLLDGGIQGKVDLTIVPESPFKLLLRTAARGGAPWDRGKPDDVGEPDAPVGLRGKPGSSGGGLALLALAGLGAGALALAARRL